MIPVAILTTSTSDGELIDFDAGGVNPATAKFGSAGAAIAHSYGHVEDVDGYSDTDVVLHFRTKETGIQCGDTEATLSGFTFDGTEIQGSDSIKTAGEGCK